MIIGTGIDITEIDRIALAIKNTERFLDSMFTKEEIEYFESRNMKPECIAGNFAGKEAFVKALGTGFVGISPKDIEILRDAAGKPYINIVKENANRKLSNSKVFISISHSQNYAVANVIIEA